MAEIVGTVAAVAQLLHLSGALLAGGYGFLSKVRRAPSEIRSLLIETAAINALLAQISLAVDSTPRSAVDDALQALARLGVFQECQEILKSIEKALVACEQLNGKDKRNLGRKLTWPFKEKETKDTLQRLHHLRSLLANAIELNSLSSLRSIEVSQGLLINEMEHLSTHVQTHMDREEAQKVISWICPLPSDGAQDSLQNALDHKYAGTGTWFVESDFFQRWKNSDDGTIWINGLPGSGKTFLCSSVIENVQQSRENTTAVLFFFCDHRDRTKITHDNFVMNITKQILDLFPSCLTEAQGIYKEKAKDGSRPFNRTDYVPFIESLLPRFTETVLLVDALDEATEEGEIANTLARLYTFGRQHSVSIKIFLTSRFDIRLEDRHPYLTSVRVTLAENMRQDIERYIDMDLEVRISRGTLKLRKRNLLESIKERVGSSAGTYVDNLLCFYPHNVEKNLILVLNSVLHLLIKARPLQARLQLDYISTARTDKDIKARMSSLPNGLEYTYQTLLCQMASKHSTRVHELKILLQCLVAASSPLTASQLSEILAMQPGERHLDFDSVATDPYDTLELVAPFIIVDKEGNESGVVKLCHYSLEEYLCSTRIQQSPANYFYIDMSEASTWLASMCLQYLTFTVFDLAMEEETDQPSLETYTFYRYAALNWFIHAYAATNFHDLAAQCDPYMNWFLHSTEGRPCFIRWKSIATQKLAMHPRIRSFSPICFLICVGLNDLALGLLPLLPSPNHCFEGGFTCLTVAAMYNNLAMAQKLYELYTDLDLNKPTQVQGSKGGLSPLHLAAEHASREVFDFLLDRGADPHVKSQTLTTPFYRACRGGDIHIVKRLKECGSDINAHTWDNWTPLMEAIENENEDIADLLLDWGANVAVGSNDGWSAFQLAEVCSPRLLEKIQRGSR